MTLLTCFLLSMALALVGYGVFLRFNMGLARNSRGQQLRRYLFGGLLSFASLLLSGCTGGALVGIVVTALLWIATYNILYDKTYRKSSPDYDNHMDIAFGIYLLGWLAGVYALFYWLSPLVGPIFFTLLETLLVAVPLVQLVYYVLYHSVIDIRGMQVILETNGNEIIEFRKSFKLWQQAAMVLPFIAVPALLLWTNYTTILFPHYPLWKQVVSVALTVFLTVFIWKWKHGVFVRTGLAMLYQDIREYEHRNAHYKQEMDLRLQQLVVMPAKERDDHPHTVIMVIGESACRDYMSAFTPQPWQTTPWETEMKDDQRHWMFFPNAYSCAMQTVPSLERALTEASLYNDKKFAEAVSIVDIAHKMGFKVHWYSNQGHIGANDTPVTLVAETSDVAKWTKQELGKPYYDSSLISFLDEVDPQKNNFVVIHLKGSHFNYEDRYTPQFAAENGLVNGDNVLNYRNSILFTDSILKAIYEYGVDRLHLQAMVYFSDHGAMPDHRRHPWFLGFRMVRIPLWVYLSDDYQRRHPEATKALKDNQQRYFTNDLAYDLMCGILDIQSQHYDPSNSLASSQYRFTREMLLTDEGRVRLTDEDTWKDKQ